MSGQRDDWEKPRSKGTHLSEDEIAFVRKGFQEHRKTHDVARDLKCSSRTITKYYGFFRAEGAPEGAPKRQEKRPLPDRFYRSNFDPL